MGCWNTEEVVNITQTNDVLPGKLLGSHVDAWPEDMKKYLGGSVSECMSPQDATWNVFSGRRLVYECLFSYGFKLVWG